MATMTTMTTMIYDVSLNHRDTLYDERTGTFLAFRDSIVIPIGSSGNYDGIHLNGRKGTRVFRYTISSAHAMVFTYRDLGDAQRPPREYTLEVYSKYEDLNKRWAELRMGHDHR